MTMHVAAPTFAFREILKYKQEIIAKAKITENSFDLEYEKLQEAVQEIRLEEYAHLLSLLGDCPDPNDIDFLATAVLLNVPLWSNDAALRGQASVKIISTREMLTAPRT
jgi:predicted nucleic acid-binding protein